MCFSASSSFTAAILLSCIGILSLKLNNTKKLIMFAAIPLLFAIQQAAEGMVWLTVENPNSILHNIGVYTFLTFAIAIWPTWIPTSLAIFDKSFRKKILGALVCLGAIIATCIVYIFFTSSISTTEVENSIFYHIHNLNNLNIKLAITAYALPTILPFFITRLPCAKIFGTVIAISLFLAYQIKYQTFTSVWCFFAAVISSAIIFTILEYNKNQI